MPASERAAKSCEISSPSRTDRLLHIVATGSLGRRRLQGEAHAQDPLFDAVVILIYVVFELLFFIKMVINWVVGIGCFIYFGWESCYE